MATNLKIEKSKESNELILRRRRRKRIKRSVITIILLGAITATLCLKLPYFAIKDIEVINNRNISTEEIKDLSTLHLGENIFYLNLNKIKKSILTNSYILNVDIKRKLPDHIKIYIKERSAVFYVKQGDKYLIIDKEGIVLEEKATIDGMKLIKLDGFDKNPYKVGEPIETKDERKLKLIGEITGLIDRLKEGVPEPSVVDISDITNINLYYGDMVIKMGMKENLEDKYNKAINILMSNNLIGKKGYIDISFNGDPVFSIMN
ncbi:cell division protein FtsQ [Clostridium novyi A str. 4552]|uniref:Cell division protein FtsQ n=1 Tax=Clostridium novyi A str. 4552 TaxID=1444289 RepID=A0A0A0I7F9_CLONO|nr:FtsQ-type POTRA domain-containing protein [Clostridium novyi]KGM97374.1 cell division protein FtsQ [Clostridium novyi A str. 4552]